MQCSLNPGNSLNPGFTVHQFIQIYLHGMVYTLAILFSVFFSCSVSKAMWKKRLFFFQFFLAIAIVLFNQEVEYFKVLGGIWRWLWSYCHLFVCLSKFYVLFCTLRKKKHRCLQICEWAFRKESYAKRTLQFLKFVSSTKQVVGPFGFGPIYSFKFTDRWDRPARELACFT